MQQRSESGSGIRQRDSNGASMKKICFITTVPATLNAFVVGVAEFLHQQAGYDITFICDRDEAFAASLPPYIHYIPVSMKRGIHPGGISAIFKMVRIFRREKFDMVQYSTPNASFYSAIAARIARIPIRKYHLMGFRYLGFDHLKRKIFKAIEKTTCALSTDVECVSPSNRALGISEKLFSADQSNVLLRGSSAGVDCDRFSVSNKERWREEYRKKLDFSEEDCVFGYVGRITGDKGINELLAAFEKSDIPHGKLLLVGPMELKQTINPELLKRARSGHRIVFHPAVEQIECYYSAIDVLVLPSYREGFGMVVAEAEAMGVPVIVTDIPGPTDAIIPGETGLLVKKADVDSLAAAMEDLARSPEKRQRFGAAARKFVAENFEQQRLYQAILQDRKRLLGEEYVRPDEKHLPPHDKRDTIE